MKHLPWIALTLGDPAGVGPEVLVKALADQSLQARMHPVVVGEIGRLQQAAKQCRRPLHFAPAPGDGRWPARLENGSILVWPLAKPAGRIRLGKWSAATGQLSYQAVLQAVEMAKRKQVAAVVTAPICKEAWRAAGIRFPGHTELLAHLTQTQRYAMMFVGGPFRLVLATIHQPLARVPQLLTRQRLVQTIEIGVRELQQHFGIAVPRVAVAGLNPHAGEGGLFGDEEHRIIAPAIRSLQRRHRARISGPYPPDTLFAQALPGVFDLIVCMYHDQGLIPFKMMALHQGVNVTAGLPIIRTSPDHGTAFDLAGTGRADPGSMIAAIRTAVEMIQHGRPTRRKGSR